MIAKIVDIRLALEHALLLTLHPHHIFTDYSTVVDLLKINDNVYSWKLKDKLERTRILLMNNPDLTLEYIPYDVSSLAYEIANFGRSN